MRLFNSMTEFDHKTNTLWTYLDKPTSYSNFLQELASQLGVDSAHELRQNCSNNASYDLQRETLSLTELFEPIQRALSNIDIDKSILPWLSKIMSETVCLSSIDGTEYIAQAILMKKPESICEFYEILDADFGPCENILLPISCFGEIEIDLTSCSESVRKRFLLSAESAMHQGDCLDDMILMFTRLHSDEVILKEAIALFTKNPFGSFHLISKASPDFLEKLERKLADNCEPQYLASHDDIVDRCLYYLFKDNDSYSRKVPPRDTPLGQADLVQHISNHSDNFYFGFGRRNLDRLEPDEFIEDLFKQASRPQVNAGEYLYAVFLSLVNGNASKYYQPFCTAISQAVEDGKLYLDPLYTQRIDEVIAFLNSGNATIEINSTSPLMERAALMKSCINNEENIQKTIRQIKTAAEKGLFNGISRFIRRVTPSIETPFILDCEKRFTDLLDFMRPLLKESAFEHDKALASALWKLSCFARHHQWIEILAPLVSDEEKELLYISTCISVEETFPDFEPEDMDDEINSARKIIEEIINPSDHWAQQESGYNTIPNFLSLLFITNQLTLEMRTLYNSSQMNVEQNNPSKELREDVWKLSNAPGSASCNERIETFLRLKKIAGYEDLKPECDGKFFYLLSEKQSEIIFNTSSGISRLLNIANFHKARKVSFVHSGHNNLEVRSLHLPLNILDFLRHDAFEFDNPVFHLFQSRRNDLQGNLTYDALRACLEREDMSFECNGSRFYISRDGLVGFLGKIKAD